MMTVIRMSNIHRFRNAASIDLAYPGGPSVRLSISLPRLAAEITISAGSRGWVQTRRLRISLIHLVLPPHRVR